MDVVAVSLLVLFALGLVGSVVRAATAPARTGKRAHGSSGGDTSWAVFSSDGGSDCGGGDSGGGGGGGCD